MGRLVSLVVSIFATFVFLTCVHWTSTTCRDVWLQPRVASQLARRAQCQAEGGDSGGQRREDTDFLSDHLELDVTEGKRNM